MFQPPVLKRALEEYVYAWKALISRLSKVYEGVNDPLWQDEIAKAQEALDGQWLVDIASRPKVLDFIDKKSDRSAQESPFLETFYDTFKHAPKHKRAQNLYDTLSFLHLLQYEYDVFHILVFALKTMQALEKEPIWVRKKYELDEYSQAMLYSMLVGLEFDRKSTFLTWESMLSQLDSRYAYANKTQSVVKGLSALKSCDAYWSESSVKPILEQMSASHMQLKNAYERWSASDAPFPFHRDSKNKHKLETKEMIKLMYENVHGQLECWREYLAIWHSEQLLTTQQAEQDNTRIRTLKKIMHDYHKKIENQDVYRLLSDMHYHAARPVRKRLIGGFEKNGEQNVAVISVSSTLMACFESYYGYYLGSVRNSTVRNWHKLLFAPNMAKSTILMLEKTRKNYVKKRRMLSVVKVVWYSLTAGMFIALVALLRLVYQMWLAHASLPALSQVMGIFSYTSMALFPFAVVIYGIATFSLYRLVRQKDKWQDEASISLQNAHSLAWTLTTPVHAKGMSDAPAKSNEAGASTSQSEAVAVTVSSSVLAPPSDALSAKKQGKQPVYPSAMSPTGIEKNASETLIKDISAHSMFKESKDAVMSSIKVTP